MPSDDLERIRLDNLAARLLPLLRALAVKGRHTIHMGVLDEQQLVVEVES
jgi:DNA-binding IclR family transcriptional regulator